MSSVMLESLTAQSMLFPSMTLFILKLVARIAFPITGPMAQALVVATALLVSQSPMTPCPLGSALIHRVSVVVGPVSPPGISMVVVIVVV